MPKYGISIDLVIEASDQSDAEDKVLSSLGLPKEDIDIVDGPTLVAEAEPEEEEE